MSRDEKKQVTYRLEGLTERQMTHLRLCVTKVLDDFEEAVANPQQAGVPPGMLEMVRSEADALDELRRALRRAVIETPEQQNQRAARATVLSLVTDEGKGDEEDETE